MIVVHRNKKEEQFDSRKLIHFMTSLINIEPRLCVVDARKVCNEVESGLSEKASSDELLTHVSEICASMGSQSFEYSMLAGRISAYMLQTVTPGTFTKAMLRVSDLLAPSFLEKVQGHNYDQYIDDKNDFQYDIIGMRTLKRSYLLKDSEGYVERPQYMLMRVAVFLTGSPEEAVNTYRVMSSGLYTHASPTLFHAGMKQHQLASCFLMTMKDDSIEGIYDSIKETALISKSAGGIGISVSNIRCQGSPISGTGGTSNGLVPMLRVFNNTARYCDQGGGKRKGSFAIFIEPWHGDIFEVLELKLNHGVEEDRARDLFYSLYITDLFMKRVEADGKWSLFCPRDVPLLQETYGAEFERHYTAAEASGKARRTVSARTLWDRILSTQMETGTPYLVYKDACNARSNQQHLGVIKSSNLCAEIVEYSSPEETAVCTLASIALPKFVEQEGFNYDKLVEVAGLVCRNLNYVVDKTAHPVESTKANNRHRPIGIGVQGLSDVYQMLGIPYDSKDASTMNKLIFESIYYGAMRASVALAERQGKHDSFDGSPASRGHFNFDLWDHVPSNRYDWEELRKRMVHSGMRNSLLTALMPTASSASILGNSESFEPRTSNLYTRRVLSGEFVILNKYLETTCRKMNVWTQELRDNIIANRGSVQNSELPKNVKAVFKTVWELSQKALIDQSRERAPYVCQSQSLNLYKASPTRASLTSMHFYAWKSGLKTGQYYLRSQPKVNAVAFTAKQQDVVMSQSEEASVCISCEA